MEECMKRQFLAFFLAFAGFMSLRAATVSVLVVEAGLPPGNGCTPSAEVWESGMMDVFFDAGHIVSNAPCLQIDEAAGTGKAARNALPPEVNHDFDEARLGGADFFVLVFLNYAGGMYTADAEEYPVECPKEVFIQVYSVSSGSLLYEVSVNARTWGSFDEEFLDAKRNAGKVVPQLVKKG